MSVDVWAMYENIAALSMGILLPSCNVSQEIAKMSPEDARKAKRKWRKLLRKKKKQVKQDTESYHLFGFVGGDDVEKYVKYRARRALRKHGRDIVNGGKIEKRDQ